MEISDKKSGLLRQMGTLGLAATGICSMLGAGINVIPFMIQRNVPGIGPFVLEAYLFAALPALLARVHGERFAGIQPANTMIQAGIIGDGYLVEMEVEAVVKE